MRYENKLRDLAKSAAFDFDSLPTSGRRPLTLFSTLFSTILSPLLYRRVLSRVSL